MRHPFSKLLGLLLIAGSFGTAWLLMDINAFSVNPMEIHEPGQSIQIQPGSTLKDVARTLAQEGVIRQPQYFVWYGRWRDAATQIRAGEYALEPGMSPAVFLDRIVAGAVMQHALTLVEGWSFRQIMAALRAHPRIEHTLDGLEPRQIMAQLGVPDADPEGQFLPDTYHFPAATKDRDFLRRAYDAMQTVLAQEWAARAPDLPLATPYEALILASIVEKETGIAEERPKIAGVFIRRLQRGMRLQTDPTVIYGLGADFDGNLRREDLLRDTPYNTYQRKGLPPTPIAAPGRAALHAVLHPEAGDSLYFVARGDGSHYFSATLDEHNAAVREYQLRKP